MREDTDLRPLLRLAAIRWRTSAALDEPQAGRGSRQVRPSLRASLDRPRASRRVRGTRRVGDGRWSPKGHAARPGPSWATEPVGVGGSIRWPSAPVAPRAPAGASRGTLVLLRLIDQRRTGPSARERPGPGPRGMASWPPATLPAASACCSPPPTGASSSRRCAASRWRTRRPVEDDEEEQSKTRSSSIATAGPRWWRLATSTPSTRCT
jgi:hypothetical protein